MPSLSSGYRQRSRISVVAVHARATPSQARALARRISMASESSMRARSPGLVTVVALAGLLTQATRRVQREVGLVVGRIGRIAIGIRRDARSRRHRCPPCRTRRGCPSPCRSARARESTARGVAPSSTMRCGLARVAFHHAVADEAVSRRCASTGRLAQRLCELHRGADQSSGEVFAGAHDLEQRHHVRRREEMHRRSRPADVASPSAISFDVQRRRVASRAPRRGRATRVELREHDLASGPCVRTTASMITSASARSA